MIKTPLLMLIGLFISAGDVLMASEVKHCTCTPREVTTAEKMVVWSLIVASPIVLVPLGAFVIVPAVTSIASTVTAYIVPTTLVGKVGLGLTAAQMARPLVVKTTEEKLHVLLKERASRHTKTKTEFIDCLKANRYNSPRNVSGRPAACEGIALSYALNSSLPELNKKTVAFKNGKCFCD